MTGQTNRYKYKKYMKLFMLIERKGLEKPGKYVNFLFDIFVKKNGYLKKAYALDAGFTDAQDFDKWVERMEGYGLLKKPTYLGKMTDYARYKPGPDILHVINEERAEHGMLVTMEEFTDLQVKVQICYEAIRILMNTINPPATKDKINSYLKKVEENYSEVGESDVVDMLLNEPDLDNPKDSIAWSKIERISYKTDFKKVRK